MLMLRGETRVDYFQVLCAACGSRVSITYLGWSGVPAIRAHCDKCRESAEFKLDPTVWATLPPKPGK
jgi:hypothetical protein